MTFHQTQTLIQGNWVPVYINDLHSYEDVMVAYAAITYLSLRNPTSKYRVVEIVKHPVTKYTNRDQS